MNKKLLLAGLMIAQLSDVVLHAGDVPATGDPGVEQPGWLQKTTGWLEEAGATVKQVAKEVSESPFGCGLADVAGKAGIEAKRANARSMYASTDAPRSVQNMVDMVLVSDGKRMMELGILGLNGEYLTDLKGIQNVPSIGQGKNDQPE